MCSFFENLNALEKNEKNKVLMDGVSEYAEEYGVFLKTLEPNEYNKLQQPRLIILATNEGGCNCTEVDLLDLIKWLKKNRPDLLA